MSTGRSGVVQTVADADDEPARVPDLAVTHPLALRALTVLWPAFVMAGVLEMLVFAVVNPADLHWFGGASVGWSASAVYSVTFLILWGVISMSGALTMLLVTEQAGGRRWP